MHNHLAEKLNKARQAANITETAIKNIEIAMAKNTTDVRYGLLLRKMRTKMARLRDTVKTYELELELAEAASNDPHHQDAFLPPRGKK